VKRGSMVRWTAYTQILSNYVLRWEYYIVISFFTTWHMVLLPDLNWYFLCSLLFYSSMSRYNSLFYSVLLCYCTVHCYLLFCVLLFAMYVLLPIWLCILYFNTVTSVNPITVNNYLSIHLGTPPKIFLLLLSPRVMIAAVYCLEGVCVLWPYLT
jgi:hypothetical protein